MRQGTALEFALTRVQARYGLRPDAGLWAHLQSIRALAPLIEALRATALRHWVIEIDADSTAHHIESALRLHLDRHIVEVAAWLPDQWRPALNWARLLPYLPALLHLFRGDPELGWMRADPTLKPYAVATVGARHEAMRASGLAALVDAWKRGKPVGATWLEEWRNRWPSNSGHTTGPLEELARMVQAHIDEATAAGSSWQGRQALQGTLEAAFRRHVLHPVKVFIYFALLALDVERLRGELVTRRLFPEAEPQP